MDVARCAHAPMGVYGYITAERVGYMPVGACDGQPEHSLGQTEHGQSGHPTQDGRAR